LRVLEYCCLKKDDPRRNAAPCFQNGWLKLPEHTGWRHASGEFTLERYMADPNPSRSRSLFTLYRTSGEPVSTCEAHWADWDQRGRLAATVGGRDFEGRLDKDRTLVRRQRAAMQDEQPAPVVAPDWARHW